MTTMNRIETYLVEHQIPYEIVDHRHSATSLESAHAAHVDPRHLAKAVLLEADDCVLAAMLPADEEVRLGHLKWDFGERLHLAEEAMIRSTFSDCDPGTVPGLPTAWGVETVWDDDLLAQPDIYLEAGDHRRLFRVATSDLCRALPELSHCHFGQPRKMHLH